LGRVAQIERLKKHPLLRALRVDKITLAALQATLLAYLEGRALEELPVWQMIAADAAALGRRAQRWRTALRKAGGPQAEVVETVSAIGGGSLPGQTLPTKALALTVPSAGAVAHKLRAGHPPVVARIEEERLIFDPRTVLPEQEKPLLEAIKAALLHVA
jgi:L-seryl-tRNA(Ser) seleniumtransferase